MSSSVFLEIVKDAPLEHFPVDAVLMEKGTRGAFCFVIVEGQVRIEQEVGGFEGRDELLRGRGDLVGEFSLFSGRRSATVRVTKPLRGARVPHQALFQLISTNPTVATALLSAILGKTVGALSSTG